MLVAREAPARAPLFSFLDLRSQFAVLRPDILSAVEALLESHHFTLGPEVELFESEVAEFLNCNYAIGCASGSYVLLLALMALGFKPGDEIITTPLTFAATAGGNPHD